MKIKRLNLILLAIFVIFFAAGPAMALTMDLQTTSTTVALGNTFKVEVWVNSEDIDEELLSFGFDVSITDGDNLSYVGYDLGTYFDDDSLLADLDVAGSTFPGVADDDVLLATLTFTAISIGMDNINVSGAYDEDGLSFSGLFYELNGFDIEASLDITVTTVPEPATIFLLGVGLLTFMGVSRKNIHT
ncbi:PEP-CTERM sorting domain-containing protein [uncultured Desulfobacter sp.]|uniref:PEP-CTERM sorting domain-containing protein n=1 Tax=uncultured Desulfobacter sp. TaxID=240139 RepID=UPI002AAA7A5A|nr:PEP-CTERM sorting domain-containing protein [uncultured Desulfobacter sp.]